MDTCKSCIHFEPGEGDGGFCFRFPPVACGIPASNPTAIATPGKAPAVGVVTVSLRPNVTRTTPACGEFELPEKGGEDEP